MQPMASSSQRSEAANTRQRQRTSACFFSLSCLQTAIYAAGTPGDGRTRELSLIFADQSRTITSDALFSPLSAHGHRQQPLTGFESVAVSLGKPKPTDLNIPYDLILLTIHVVHI